MNGKQERSTLIRTTDEGPFRPSGIGKSSPINENLTAVGNSFESLYADGSAVRRKRKAADAARPKCWCSLPVV